MLKYFFEKSTTNYAHLFQDLSIVKEPDYFTFQGKYPVIFISFKDVNFTEFETCFKAIQSLIADEFKRHAYLFEHLSTHEKDRFNLLLTRQADKFELSNSLKFLTELLSQFNAAKVVVLIDEYDTPINSAYLNGFYPEMIDLIRGILRASLKDNDYLAFGVVTGIYRVAKESIFSGINNLEVCTILSRFYADKFGFTEAEVVESLKYFSLAEHLPEVKTWYNGYQFHETVIYNPWSIINYLKNQIIQPYWVNTSNNEIIKDLLRKSNTDIKSVLTKLLEKESILTKITEDTTFNLMQDNNQTILSFLLFSGYLKLENNGEKPETYSLKIPNQEILSLYKDSVMEWFYDHIQNSSLDFMLKSLVTGDIATFSLLFQEILLNTISIFDVSGRDDQPEIFYHAFVLGLLVYLEETHLVKSNQEAGYGRYDLLLIPKDQEQIGIIIEFKKVRRDQQENLETAANNALQQIESRQYAQVLLNAGIKKIIKLGIAFAGKKVLIKESR